MRKLCVKCGCPLLLTTLPGAEPERCEHCGDTDHMTATLEAWRIRAYRSARPCQPAPEAGVASEVAL